MSDNNVGLGLSAAPAVSHTRVVEAKLRLEAQVKNGAGWFFWIAALSMINTVIMLSGSRFHFIFGLGITTIVDVIANKVGGAGTVAAFIVNAFIAGVLVLFAVYGRKGQKWAFIVGMALYALDALLFLLLRDLLGLAFHAYALFSIYKGFAAVDRFNQIQQQSLATSPAPIGD